MATTEQKQKRDTIRVVTKKPVQFCLYPFYLCLCHTLRQSQPPPTVSILISAPRASISLYAPKHRSLIWGVYFLRSYSFCSLSLSLSRCSPLSIFSHVSFTHCNCFQILPIVSSSPRFFFSIILLLALEEILRTVVSELASSGKNSVSETEVRAIINKMQKK